MTHCSTAREFDGLGRGHGGDCTARSYLLLNLQRSENRPQPPTTSPLCSNVHVYKRGKRSTLAAPQPAPEKLWALSSCHVDSTDFTGRLPNDPNTAKLPRNLPLGPSMRTAWHSVEHAKAQPTSDCRSRAFHRLCSTDSYRLERWQVPWPAQDVAAFADQFIATCAAKCGSAFARTASAAMKAFAVAESIIMPAAPSRAIDVVTAAAPASPLRKGPPHVLGCVGAILDGAAEGKASEGTRLLERTRRPVDSG